MSSLAARQRSVERSKREFLKGFHHAIDSMKTGMYEGMDIVSREMENEVRAGHMAIGWYNEPLGRGPGDLEATTVGFVVPAQGDQKFLKERRDVMANWGDKSMEAGMTIVERDETPHTLSDMQIISRHTDPDTGTEIPEPFVVRALVGSPMEYEKFQEDPAVPKSYPVIERVMEKLGAEVLTTVADSMRLK